MRVVKGLIACLIAMPVLADGSWRVMTETSAEIVSVDLASLERSAGIVSFRERHSMRDGQMNPGSMRPVREVLSRRQIDCNRKRMATLSRAVFSDNDAMIDHRAVRPQHAEWRPIAKDDPMFRIACGSS